jgi:hypothetical protein
MAAAIVGFREPIRGFSSWQQWVALEQSGVYSWIY